MLTVNDIYRIIHNYRSSTGKPPSTIYIGCSAFDDVVSDEKSRYVLRIYEDKRWLCGLRVYIVDEPNHINVAEETK